MTDIILQLDEIHELVRDVMTRAGVSTGHAGAVADTVTAAERDDCKAHGLFRVPEYLAAVLSGNTSPDAVPQLTELAPAVLQIDGGNSFAPLALQYGRDALVKKTREQGIALLAIVHSCHNAALWLEVEALCEKGLVALACVNNASFVVPAGGSSPLYGTNPIAFGWPRKDKPPVIFDQATSAGSRGDIMLHEMRDEPIPAGWAIDPDGQATTGASRALAGSQLPMGGYKGAGFSLMVELLAGALIGDTFSFELSEKRKLDETITARGECIIAIDPARCTGAENRERQLVHAESLFSRILEQEGTRLPSDRRYAARERAEREGVLVSQELLEKIKNFPG